MNNLENIQLTPKFIQFCDLFNVTPETLVQDYINHIDLAKLISSDFSQANWPNMHAIEYIDEAPNLDEIYSKFQELVAQIIQASEDSSTQNEINCQELIDQWHQKVLESRINNILKEQ